MANWTAEEWQQFQLRRQGDQPANAVLRAKYDANREARRLPGNIFKLSVAGHCPTKKNGYSPAGANRVRIRSGIAEHLPNLLAQIRYQWQADPIEYAKVSMTFYVRDGRADLDGKFTTMLDLLVKGGVLKNDSIARIRSISAEAVISEHEHVEIEIQERAEAKKARGGRA